MDDAVAMWSSSASAASRAMRTASSTAHLPFAIEPVAEGFSLDIRHREPEMSGALPLVTRQGCADAAASRRGGFLLLNRSFPTAAATASAFQRDGQSYQ